MRLRYMAAVLVLSIVGLGPGDPARAGEPDRLDEVLWWLPPDTQTILVARGPWKVEVPGPGRGDRREEGIGRLDDYLRSMASGLPVERRTGESPGPAVAFAVEGSRHFRSPKDLGMMPYEGAHIVVFQQPLGDAVEAIKRSVTIPPGEPSFAGDPTLRKERIAGHEVLSYERKSWADVWTIHVTQPRPDVLITATDRRYLAVLLSRISKKGEKRALPDNLPEWKHLDAGKAVWAIRRYDRSDVAEDPTSPLTGKSTAANIPDERAIGFVFTLDAGKTDVARIKCVSSNEHALTIARDAWTAADEGLKPEIRQAAPGVVEVSWPARDPVGGDSLASFFLLLLLGAPGHGVYI